MNPVLFLVNIALLFGGFASASNDWTADQTNCVKWVAQKRLLLFKEVEVTGYNCSIEVSVLRRRNPSTQSASQPAGSVTRQDTNYRSVSVLIPLNRFDSGEPDRDASVTGLLGGQTSPNIEFTSMVMSPQQWTALDEGTLKSLNGTLTINQRSHPITLSIRYDSAHLYGFVQTRFSSLRLQPPTVAGGAISKVRQPLRLEFKLARKRLTQAVLR